MRRLLNGKTMDEVAIERLRAFEAEACAMHPNGYWLAYSGGKDSVVVRDLIIRSSVAHTAHHSLTTVDAPETVEFVRSTPGVVIERPPETMWQICRREKTLPQRNMRFCCGELKERGGSGRVVVTGIRWAESGRRSKRGMMEACYRDKTRKIFNPIIDWPTDAVWEYIHERNLPYCKLYDEGFERIGCVLCPMQKQCETERDLIRFPQLADAWKRTCYAIFDPNRKGRKGQKSFTSPEEQWQHWLKRNASRAKDSQPVLFEDDPSL